MSVIGKLGEKIIEYVLLLIYAKEKRNERIVLGLMVLGFVLRLIAALNQGVLADDMLYASQSAGIVEAGILSTHSNPPLFFYFTDIAYKILGYTTLASRVFPLICGTLLIPLIFLITRKLFNSAVGLTAAFFITFSNFLVRMTFSEHSLVVFFFSFLAIYLGMLYLDRKNFLYLVAAGIVFGLAILTKYNAPFFILSFLIFTTYYFKHYNETIFTKERIKQIIVFLAIIFVFALPFIAFNYFIYQEKGILDVYFSRIIHVEKAQELYGGLSGQEKGFFENLATPGSYQNYRFVFQTDLLLGLFALGGILLMLRRKLYLTLVFFFVFLVLPFVLQSAGSTLYKHFAFMHIVFAIPAGYALYEVLVRIKSNGVKWSIISVLALILIINIGGAVGTPQHYLSASETSQLKSFINSNVGEKDLILFDSRIYTAQSVWLATNNHYLQLEYFPNFYLYNLNMSQNSYQPTNVYLVECTIEDCGWGWVSQQQSLNRSIESLIGEFSSSAETVAHISSKKYQGNEFFDDSEATEKFTVYKMTLPLSPELVEQTDLINSFYFTPYLYKNMKNYTYNYETYGLMKLIDIFSHLIIYVALVVTLFSFVFPIILLGNTEKRQFR